MFEEVNENCWGDGYRIATQGLRLSEPKREMRMIQLQEVTQQARFNTKDQSQRNNPLYTPICICLLNSMNKLLENVLFANSMKT